MLQHYPAGSVLFRLLLQSYRLSLIHICSPVIHKNPLGESIHRQILHIYDARGNELEHAVEMTGRLYTMLSLFMQTASPAMCIRARDNTIAPANTIPIRAFFIFFKFIAIKSPPALKQGRKISFVPASYCPVCYFTLTELAVFADFSTLLYALIFLSGTSIFAFLLIPFNAFLPVSYTHLLHFPKFMNHFI